MINLIPYRINVYDNVQFYLLDPFNCNNIMVYSPAEHEIAFSTSVLVFFFFFDDRSSVNYAGFISLVLHYCSFRLFWKGCVYGCNNDGERFGFFCHAALEFLLQGGFHPVFSRLYQYANFEVSCFLYSYFSKS